MVIYGNVRDGVVKKETVDLHVHSNKSDGSYTPEELVDYAIEKELSAMALTDHDTVDGLSAIREYAAKKDNAPEIINGIELSTDFQGHDIHIVGLFIDDKNAEFLKWLQDFKSARELRNKKMCDALRDGLGMDISIEQLMERFPNAVITRGHYAKYMLEKGYVSSLKEPFEKWIGDTCPYFIPREKITPFDGVDLISKAGGLSILAHPMLYSLESRQLETLVRDLKAHGLDGIEAIYTTYSSDDTAYVKYLAEREGLLISGGSDFHGANKVNTDLGTGRGNLMVPMSVLDKMKAYRNEKQ